MHGAAQNVIGEMMQEADIPDGLERAIREGQAIGGTDAAAHAGFFQGRDVGGGNVNAGEALKTPPSQTGKWAAADIKRGPVQAGFTRATHDEVSQPGFRPGRKQQRGQAVNQRQFQHAVQRMLAGEPLVIGHHVEEHRWADQRGIR